MVNIDGGKPTPLAHATGTLDNLVTDTHSLTVPGAPRENRPTQSAYVRLACGRRESLGWG